MKYMKAVTEQSRLIRKWGGSYAGKLPRIENAHVVEA